MLSDKCTAVVYVYCNTAWNKKLHVHINVLAVRLIIFGTSGIRHSFEILKVANIPKTESSFIGVMNLVTGINEEMERL